MPFIRRRTLNAQLAEAVQKAALGPGAPPGAISGTTITNPALAATQAAYAATGAMIGGTPADIEQSMYEQGFNQTGAFSPGRPINPFAGYGVEPRAYDYAVGHNINARPRSGRQVSFETLRAVIDSYDIARICINHRIDDVRSLDWSVIAADTIEADVTDDIMQARRILARPDGRNPFHSWLAMWMEDVLRYDAGALYKRRDNAGRVIGLEVVDGTTICPQLDYFGRRPEAPAPAYVQFIEGLPWDWLTDRDLIYTPFRPQTGSPYGSAPLETVLLSVNSDLRFQQFFLQYFTDGSMPGGIMEAPPDASDPDQLERFQEYWDAVMEGDQAKKHQIKWVPAGSKFSPTRDDPFSDAFPLFLLHKVCAAFNVTPNDLGFTETVNRATGDTQVDIQFRVGTLPLVRHVEGVLNSYLQEDLGLPVQFKFDTGQEKEDREKLSKAWQIGVFTGAVSPDEMRAEVYGLPVDNSRPVPRFIMDTKTGPVPLRSLFAIAGPTDPATGAPLDDVALDLTPFSGAEGVMPSKNPGGIQFKRAPIDPDEPNFPQLEQEVPGTDVAGVIPPSLNATRPAVDVPVAKDMTAGVTAATGITGVNLHGTHPAKNADDHLEAAIAAAEKELRRWRDNARSRVKKGLTPRRFADTSLPDAVVDDVWTRLAGATDRATVDEAFATVAKAGGYPKAPGSADRWAGHRYDLKLAAHYAPLIAAALKKALAPVLAAANEYTTAHANTDPSQVTKAADPAGYNQAVTYLSGIPVNTTEIQSLLQQMWADSWLVGTHAAAETTGPGASIAAGLQPVIENIRWSEWVPGDARVADLISSTDATSFGFRELLNTAEFTIKGAQTVADGIISTNLDRLATAIANGIANGDSVDKVGRGLRDITVDADRAQMIAQTETARAVSSSAEAVYRFNGLTGKRWLVMDPCPTCQDNEDAGVIGIDEDFPSGDSAPPAHPRCRCALSGATLNQ